MLAPHHLEMLKQSGLTDAVIEARGYETTHNKAYLLQKKFSRSQRETVSPDKPGLLIPVRGVRADPDQPSFHQLRPDQPRDDAKSDKPGKKIKYETPPNVQMVVDVHPFAREWLKDPKIPLFITEGIKKGDAGVSRGLCTVALLGVWNFRGTNEKGGKGDLDDWRAIPLNADRPVYIVFDSDVMQKKAVHLAMVRLKKLLEGYGATNVRFIYLESGPNGEKVGLDDFLLNVPRGQEMVALQVCSTAEVRRLEDDDANDPDTAERRQYQYATGGIWWWKNGERVRLVNCHFRINADVVQDDGSETSRVFEIEGYIDKNGNSRHPRILKVRADKFESMEWVRDNFGAAAIISPIQGATNRIRHAIQLHSGEITERIDYTHLGWRVIDGEHCFLHTAGAIGPDGAVPDLQATVEGMERYSLPDPPAGEELREAVRRSLAFLDTSDRLYTWPLYAAIVTAPLAGVLPADFVLWVSGETGSRKSTAARLILNHFGVFNRTTPFPANFTSTPNSVEQKLFLAKDSPCVIDDYNPAGTLKEQQRRDAVAERILDAVGNLGSRERLNQEGKRVASKVPRCMAIVTAESAPPGAESRVARAFLTDWLKPAVRLDRLTYAQTHDAPLYGLAMAGYLQWLAPQMPELTPAYMEEQIRKVAAKMPNTHGRIEEAAAKLFIGITFWLKFAESCGAINVEEARVLHTEARKVLSWYAERTGAAQGERKPSVLFVEYLRSLINGGKAHLIDRKSGACPQVECPGRWGFQQPRGNDVDPLPPHGSTKVGWVDLQKGQLLLDGQTVFTLLTRYSRDAGTLLTGTKRGWGEMLDREGMLLDKAPGRWEQSVRTCDGKQLCWVLSINLLPDNDGYDDDGYGDDPGPPSPPQPPPGGLPAKPRPPAPDPAPDLPRTMQQTPDSQQGGMILGNSGGSGGATPNGENGNGDSVPVRCPQNCPQNESILRTVEALSPPESETASRIVRRPGAEVGTESGVSEATVTQGNSPADRSEGAVPPRLQNAHPPPALSAERLHVTCTSQLSGIIESLASAPAVGVDCETTGLNPRRDRVRLLQLAVPGRTWVIDCFQVDPRPLWPVLADRTLIAHNARFELEFLGSLDFVPGRCEDTMLYAELVSASGDKAPKGFHSLGEVLPRHCGLRIDKSLQTSDWSGPLSAAQLDYAAYDAEVMLPLRDQLRAEITAAGLEEAAKIEMRCLPAMAWLAASGVPFHVEGWLQLEAEARAEVERLRAALDEQAPRDPGRLDMGNAFRWRDAADIKHAMSLLGFRLKDTGQLTLAGVDHPLARTLTEWREADGRVSRYGRNWLKFLESGRIYTDWHQLGSRAGRMSNSDPCVQQSPRDSRYRACIAAPDGRVLVKADYSQIELRVASLIAQDQRMQQAYREGEDLHTLTARLLLGREFADAAEQKLYRQYSKAVNFGFLFGMGWETFIGYALLNFGVVFTPAQAQDYRRRWLREFRGIASWQDRHRRDEPIETRTLTGRRRVNVRNFTQKLNTPVQGTAADGLKRALALLWERRHQCPGAFPIIACHDELVVECDQDQAPDAAAWLERAMLDGMQSLVHPVPVAVEVQVGPTWAG